MASRKKIATVSDANEARLWASFDGLTRAFYEQDIDLPNEAATYADLARRATEFAHIACELALRAARETSLVPVRGKSRGSTAVRKT